MIEAIEKIRNWSTYFDNTWIAENGGLTSIINGYPEDGEEARNMGVIWRELADEIEREIDNRYLELPLDADGVPLRIGDEVRIIRDMPRVKLSMDKVYTVRGISSKIVWLDENALSIYQKNVYAHEVRHANRTIKDVLLDFLEAFDEWDDNSYGEHRYDALEELLAKYAAKIRELKE